MSVLPGPVTLCSACGGTALDWNPPHPGSVSGRYHRLCLEALTAGEVSFPGGASVKDLPANAGGARDRGSMASSLGWEDPLWESTATHSSILAWRVPWTEEPLRYSPRGRKESDRTE